MPIFCFDLDDTLCDTWQSERIARFKLIEKLAALTETPSDMIARSYDHTWAVVRYNYIDMINDDLTEHQIRTMQINLILEDHHIEADPAQLAEEFIINVMEKIHIYPDAETTINTLAEKYTLCMITNGAKDNQRLKIDRLPFRHHFTEIIISGDIKHHKPDPVIFNTMTTRLKTAPKEMTYIGNDYQKDIQGAHNAGWKTVWVNRKNEPHKAPDHTIMELTELLKVY